LGSANKHKTYKDAENPMPRKNRLTEDQIEKIHKAFIETSGFVRKTAKHTGFGKSTVSRYAKSRGWYEELSNMDLGLDTQANKDEAQEGKERITANLRKIRQFLFDEIMGDGEPKKTDQSSLKIAPRTLSEAVKALIDVDKRISEREDTQQDVISNPYRRILENCARMAKGESESI